MYGYFFYIYMGIRAETNRVVSGEVRSFKIASPLTNQETPKNNMAQASSQKTGLQPLTNGAIAGILAIPMSTRQAIIA